MVCVMNSLLKCLVMFVGTDHVQRDLTFTVMVVGYGSIQIVPFGAHHLEAIKKWPVDYEE